MACGLYVTDDAHVEHLCELCKYNDNNTGSCGKEDDCHLTGWPPEELHKCLWEPRDE